MPGPESKPIKPRWYYLYFWELVVGILVTATGGVAYAFSTGFWEGAGHFIMLLGSLIIAAGILEKRALAKRMLIEKIDDFR